jgi:hypothetical protein
LGAYHTAAIISVTCALYTWGDNSKGQVTVGFGSSIQTIFFFTFFWQLGSGDKKAYHAPYCVTGTAGAAEASTGTRPRPSAAIAV